MVSELKLHLGCGSQVVEGWVNVDYALGARLARMPMLRMIVKKLHLFNLDWNNSIFIHDLTKPFPWRDGSVGFVYSSHTLEHLDRESGLSFLKECYRVLRPGGVIRIVVPDLEEVVARYNSGELKAEYFLEQLYVLRGKAPRSIIKKFFWLYVRFPHQCMYDHESLLRIMENVGFSSERKIYADSSIPEIKCIEIEDRTLNAVVVEGKKKV